MIICLSENQKTVLRKLLTLSENNGGKKRIHFKKAELESIFGFETHKVIDIFLSLKNTRFLDIPFQNKLQIDVSIYKEMIEEQLAHNAHYVRKHKEWPDNSVFIKKTSSGDMFGGSEVNEKK